MYLPAGELVEKKGVDGSEAHVLPRHFLAQHRVGLQHVGESDSGLQKTNKKR